MDGMEFEGVIVGARENKILEWGYAHSQEFRNRLQGEYKVCRRWMMDRRPYQLRDKTSDNSLLSVVDSPKVATPLDLEVRQVCERVSCPPLDYGVVG